MCACTSKSVRVWELVGVYGAYALCKCCILISSGHCVDVYMRTLCVVRVQERAIVAFPQGDGRHG